MTFAASSMAPRGTLPAAQRACAIHEGDLGRWQEGSPDARGRRCESYWADDTSDDAPELAAGKAGSMPGGRGAAPLDRARP